MSLTVNLLTLITATCVSPNHKEVLYCKSEIVNCIVETSETVQDLLKSDILKCIQRGKSKLKSKNKEEN